MKTHYQRHQQTRELAENFASYFHSKIDTIREKFKGIDSYNPQPREVPGLVKFAPVLPSELGKIIHRMPPKTCQLDQVPTNKLQEILDGCLPALSHITNRSLELGKFAEKWKEAIVKPLIKKKQLGTINSNYRPVSNLSFISKIVEKVTLEQFNDHCNQHSLLPEYQSAYRKHHSCETLDQVIDTSQLELNGFTDNHSIRRSFKPSITAVKHWTK